MSNYEYNFVATLNDGSTNVVCTSTSNIPIPYVKGSFIVLESNGELAACKIESIYHVVRSGTRLNRTWIYLDRGFKVTKDSFPEME